MINCGFIIRSVDGLVANDGSPLILKCYKDKGLSLMVVRGLNRTLSREFDPTDARIEKVGHGRFNAWTNRYPGAWATIVSHADGVTTFRMKNKGDAIALERWVKKYAARKGGA